jgi:hypothetical protein
MKLGPPTLMGYRAAKGALTPQNPQEEKGLLLLLAYRTTKEASWLKLASGVVGS